MSLRNSGAGVEPGRRSSVLALPKPPRREAKPRTRIARKTKPRRVRKTSRARMGRMADKLWAQAVKSGGGGFCEYGDCYSRAIDAHHVFGRGAHPRLRLDSDNGIGLCRPHHNAWHRKPTQFRAWFATFYPQTWERLQVKAQRESRLA